MAYDTNPYFSNTSQPQQPGQQPGQPTLNNGTPVGGVAAVIKAIMDGNDQYKQQQAAKMGMMGQPQGVVGPTAGGTYNAPSSPGYTDPSTQSGGLAMPSAPFTSGGSAAVPSYGGSSDPTMSALMGPIPSGDMGAGFTMPNPLSVGGSWGS